MARRLNSKCVRQPVSARLNLEQFERRIVPASFVVKTTADAGPDTLRAAISALNTTSAAEASTITFSFPPGGPLLFTPLSPYPALTRKATFLTDTPTEKRVEISGLAAGPAAAGLVFTAGGYIEDVAITGWMGFGISLLGGKTTVIDSYIGTDHGGTKAIGNKSGGINIMSSGNTIFNCVVSGNGGPGVQLKGAGAGGNSISSSQIGVGGDSVTAIKNAGAGIFCEDAPGNLFGTTLFGNVVSGNGGTGVHIKGPTAIGNKIVASYIGVGKDGSAQPNLLGGVFIEGGSSTTIGGAAPMDANVISSNFLHGVAIIGVTGKDNLLRGNKIGVGIDGMADRGNKFSGVFIGGGASLNFVGKPAADHANIIAFNGVDLGAKGHGVVLAADAGLSNVIQWNSIYKNYGRGIDLNADWVTINDATKLAVDKLSGDGDSDVGPNGLQDYPMVISRPNVGIIDSGIHKWSLNSKGSSTFTIDFYDNTGLPLGEYAEGKTYIIGASQTVVTNVFGNVEFDFDHTGYANVTATATDAMGNTSEFSMVDTDADGLADVWELADGLDINEDGILTVNELILSGSNMYQKDLFVEVDAMTGFAPGAAIFNPATPAAAGGVINAFSLATNINIHNPDQAAGIDLHVVYDETNIAPEEFALDTNFTRFHEIKNGKGAVVGRFGTPTQRADVNWVQIREALTLTHRYSMFASKYSFTSKDAMGNVNKDSNGKSIIIDSSSGLGELHGNDFFVTFGADVWNTAKFGLTDVDRAGTWMHELGHTLGLNHGGAINDKTNDKPNYHSVMNYVWQYPQAFNRTGAAIPAYANSWRLDYSSETLGDLDESKLAEGNGISVANPAFTVPFGELGMGYGLAKADGNGINWNFDGVTGGTVQIDINFSGGKTDVFQGHNDWANLRYNFLERASFASGYSEEPDSDNGPRPYLLPHVASVKINDGSAQRSRVTSLTVTFDQHIDITFSLADAFVVTRQGDGKLPTLVTSVDDSGATTVVTLTFLGTNAVDYGSLADGRYTLTVIDNKVSNGFGMLDGDGNGQPGGNYVLASAVAPNPPTNIFRFFGDSDGDGNVAANDFIQFRLALGGSNPIFDFDGDGAVAASDFIQFRLRFGGSV